MREQVARWHAEQIRALGTLALNAAQESIGRLQELVQAAERCLADPDELPGLLDAFGRADTTVANAVLALGSVHDHLQTMPGRTGDVGAPPVQGSTVAEA